MTISSSAPPDVTTASYAGDISPAEAWALLEKNPATLLVDVRTDAEWAFVGGPDLSSLGRTVARIAWQVYPGMAVNPDFAADVAAMAPDKAAPLLLLCRSGVRSRAAAIAMTAAGYSQCWNIAGGFEGNLDAAKHRGNKDGWKAANLPWSQT